MYNLKWGFPTQNRNNQGVGNNNSGLQAYGGDAVTSIVREAIQNSQDASVSRNKVVNVSISYGYINMEKEGYKEFGESLLSVEGHIRLCKDKYQNDSKIPEAKVYIDMLNKIGHFKRLKRIPYLKIKDSGTIGMYHNRSNPTKGRLCTFIHEDGENNANNQNGGGANGIGKMAYFAMSPLRMVLVSTFAKENSNSEEAQAFFSGAIKLVTHNVPDNNTLQYQYAGYMPPIPDDVAFKPLIGEEVDKLPFLFTRRPSFQADPELGSTIYIIGCEPENLDEIEKVDDYDKSFTKAAEKSYSILAESVLKNYWLSIYKNRLVVTLGTPSSSFRPIEISSSNIFDILKEGKFIQDKGIGRRIDSYNPYYFIKALNANPGEDENLKSFELDLDRPSRLKDMVGREKKLGKVRLYLNIDESLQGNMIVAMRSPMMTVCKYTVGTNAGAYAGVLVCDEEGNFCDELLRASEPHTHDKWDAGQARGHGHNTDAAKLLLKTIKEWVDDQLNQLFVLDSANSARFLGMSEFLCFYNPEDASQRDSLLNTRDLSLSGETSKISIKERSKKESKGTKASYIHEAPVIDEEDDKNASGGNGGNGGGGNGEGYTKPNRNVRVDDKGHISNIATELKLKARCFAQENSGIWEYSVVLYGNNTGYNKIALKFEEQNESSLTRGYLRLLDASEGIISSDKTQLRGISLEANKQKIIKVRFKMDTRRIALKIVSTLDELHEQETI